nr:enolase 2 [Tanacetum cinerariifolium]
MIPKVHGKETLIKYNVSNNSENYNGQELLGLAQKARSEKVGPGGTVSAGADNQKRKEKTVLREREGDKIREERRKEKEIERRLEAKDAAMRKKTRSEKVGPGGTVSAGAGSYEPFEKSMMDIDACLELLKTAIAKAGYTNKVVIGIDVVASELYGEIDKTYDLNFKEE